MSILIGPGTGDSLALYDHNKNYDAVLVPPSSADLYWHYADEPASAARFLSTVPLGVEVTVPLSTEIDRDVTIRAVPRTAYTPATSAGDLELAEQVTAESDRLSKAILTVVGTAGKRFVRLGIDNWNRFSRVRRIDISKFEDFTEYTSIYWDLDVRKAAESGDGEESEFNELPDWADIERLAPDFPEPISWDTDTYYVRCAHSVQSSARAEGATYRERVESLRYSEWSDVLEFSYAGDDPGSTGAGIVGLPVAAVFAADTGSGLVDDLEVSAVEMGLATPYHPGLIDIEQPTPQYLGGRKVWTHQQILAGGGGAFDDWTRGGGPYGPEAMDGTGQPTLPQTAGLVFDSGPFADAPTAGAMGAFRYSSTQAPARYHFYKATHDGTGDVDDPIWFDTAHVIGRIAPAIWTNGAWRYSGRIDFALEEAVGEESDDVPMAIEIYGGLASSDTTDETGARGLRVDRYGNAVLGQGALAADAVGGFAYLPQFEEVPTEAPAAVYEGYVPVALMGTSLIAWDGSAWIGSGGGGSSKWSALTAPDDHLSLDMNGYKTAFTWDATTGGDPNFIIQDSTDDNGGALLYVRTTNAGSQKAPLRVDARNAIALAVTTEGVTEVTGAQAATAEGEFHLFKVDLDVSPASMSFSEIIAARIALDTTTEFDLSNLRGAHIAVTHSQAGDAVELSGLVINYSHGGTGTVNSATGLSVNGAFFNDTSGAVTSVTGIASNILFTDSHGATTVTAIQAGIDNSSDETIETIYGLRVAHAVFGNVTNRYGVVVESTGGWSGFGTGSPRGVLEAANGNVILGDDLATNATLGFTYLPSMDGEPEGTPTTIGDAVPIVIDRTGAVLYGYVDGNWEPLSGAGSAEWDNILDPDDDQALDMGAHTTAWAWASGALENSLGSDGETTSRAFSAAYGTDAITAAAHAPTWNVQSHARPNGTGTGFNYLFSAFRHGSDSEDDGDIPAVYNLVGSIESDSTGAAHDIVGVAGFGISRSGSTARAWGLFGDARVESTTGVAVGAELTARNHLNQTAPALSNSSVPDGAVIGLTLAPHKSHNAAHTASYAGSAALWIARGEPFSAGAGGGANTGTSWRSGIVFTQSSFIEYGIDFYFASGLSPAIRLANSQWVVARNNADDADIALVYLDSSDFLNLRGGRMVMGAADTFTVNAYNQLSDASMIILNTVAADNYFYAFDDGFAGELKFLRSRGTRTAQDNLEDDDVIYKLVFLGRVGGTFNTYSQIWSAYNSGGSALHLAPDTSGGTVRIWGDDLIIDGAITFADDVRQTFNPGTNNAGLNVGSIAGDPSSPQNGDLWYDSTANELTARINGANVALGGGSTPRLDQVLDPNTTTVFNMGTNSLTIQSSAMQAVFNTVSMDHYFYQYDDGFQGEVKLLRARGTRTEPENIESSDGLGVLRWIGRVGDSYNTYASLGAVYHTDGSYLWTSADRFWHTGKLGIDMLPEWQLHIDGNEAPGPAGSAAIVVQSDANQHARIEVRGAAQAAPTFVGRGARGTGISSPAAPQNTDFLAVLGGSGYDGASDDSSHLDGWSYALAGIFAIRAAETWSDTAHGTYATIETTPTGSTTRALAFAVDSNADPHIKVVSSEPSDTPSSFTGLAPLRLYSEDGTYKLYAYLGSDWRDLTGAGGSTPRLDQVLDPNTAKVFDMDTNALTFKWATTGSTNLIFGEDAGRFDVALRGVTNSALTHGALLAFQKGGAGGGYTFDTPTNVGSTSYIGGLVYEAWSNGAWRNVGQLFVHTSNTFSTTDYSGAMIWGVTPTGGINPVETLRLQNGKVGVGNLSGEPNATLHVAGTQLQSYASTETASVLEYFTQSLSINPASASTAAHRLHSIDVTFASAQNTSSVRLRRSIVNHNQTGTVTAFYVDDVIYENSAGTTSQIYGYSFGANVNAGATMTAIGAQFPLSVSGGTLSDGCGVQVVATRNSGTFTTATGFRMVVSGSIGTVYGVLLPSGSLSGFGTAAPEATLHVSGSVRLDLGSDAAGDILYRGTNNLARLGIGSSGTFLKSTGSAPSWAALAASDIASGELALARGGTGASLSNPGADRILFWDNSAGAVTWLAVGSGLSISGTTISATGGGGGSPGGSGSEIQYRSDASTFGAVTSSSVSGADVTFGGIVQSLSSSAGSAIDQTGLFGARLYNSIATDAPQLWFTRGRGSRTSPSATSAGDLLSIQKHRYHDGSFGLDGIVETTQLFASNTAVYRMKAISNNVGPSDRLILSGYKTLTNNTATDLFKISYSGAEKKYVGALLVITAGVKNSSAVHSITRAYVINSIHWNSGGFGQVEIAPALDNGTGDSVSDGGTITLSLSAANGDEPTVRVTVNSSLSSTTQFEVIYNLVCAGEKDFTLL